MKERFVTILAAAVLGSAALLLLPPGFSGRLQGGLRYITKPAQAWSDWAARVARAAAGEAQQPRSAAALLAQTQAELAQFRLEYRAADAAQKQMAHDLKLLNASMEAYPSKYSVAFAKVVRRDPLISYYDTVMIDKGATDGLKIGQYVAEMPARIPGFVDSQEPCMLGVVEQVTATSAQVRLLSSPKISVACYVPGRAMSGVLCGMEQLGMTDMALEAPAMRLVIANPMGRGYDAVVEGDRVFTSGMGNDGNGVANIQIGIVTESTLREDGTPVVMVQPTAALWNFTHAMVILGTPSKKRN